MCPLVLSFAKMRMTAFAKMRKCKRAKITGVYGGRGQGEGVRRETGDGRV